MSIRLLEHIRDELRGSGAIQNTPEFCTSWLGRSEGYIRICIINLKKNCLIHDLRLFLFTSRFRGHMPTNVVQPIIFKRSIISTTRTIFKI